MPKVKVYDLKAQECGTVTLKDEVFGCEYNEPLIHEVVVAYLANQRQGNKSTLTRSEVRGHAKKPWRQKHTGRARHGSTKGPQWTGGGVVFAPKPRDFSKKVNKQAKQVAFKSALSAKLAANELKIVNDFNVEAKTKEVQNILDAFNVYGNILFVVEGENEKLLLASRNIPGLEVVNSELLNTYEIVANRNVFVSKAAAKSIQEAYVK